MEESYRYSGKVTPVGVVFGLVCGCVAAVVLSIPYGYITAFIPFIYLNLIATLGLGALVGLCAGWGARKGNLQNPALYVLIGLIAGLLAEYCNWVYWIFILSEHQVVIEHPAGLVVIAKEVMKEGTWGMTSGGNVTGVFLALVWACEGVMIVGASAVLAYLGLATYICCPDCTVWFKDPTKTLSYEVPEDPDQLIADLEALNFGALKNLEPRRTGKSVFLRLEIYFCPKCSQFGCFDLKLIELEQKKDKIEEKATDLIERQLFPKGGLAELVQ